MAHVYRKTFERGLQHQPEAERLQLLADFRHALSGALHGQIPVPCSTLAFSPFI